MGKTSYDLGDLSFTPQELEELRKAEQEERGHSSATSSVPGSESEPEKESPWWGKWIIQRITSK